MSDRPAAPGRQVDDARKPPGLIFNGVTLGFDSNPLITLAQDAIAASEITCLLGTSGVGKSTLLRAIAGLIPPLTGAIVATDSAPLADRVGFMTQQDGLLPWLPIWRNVALGDRLRGRVGDQARALELLTSMGLAANANDLPHTLSGGMRQRVALARVLYEDRPIVLMDEPFSALDAVTRDRLQSLAVERLSGRTVVMVTHDPLEALRVGHTIRVLGHTQDRVQDRAQGCLLGDIPAQLSAPVRPESPPPRSLTDQTVTNRHGQLMAQLQGAAA
ncbi:MAG: ATP-binding cassette domain-containing protein [Pseudomonadota bacterium]